MPGTENNADVLVGKLLSFLNKITQGSSKNVDEAYLDKLVTSIATEFALKKLSFTEILAWFETNLTQWAVISRDVAIGSFLVRLCGVLAREKSQFQSLVDTNVANSLLGASSADHANSSVRCSYLTAMCGLVNHEPGRAWLREQAVWKKAVVMAVQDPSMYVRRQARDLLRLILATEKDNSQDITEELLRPVLTCLQDDPTGAAEDEVERKTAPTLKLIDGLLDDCVAAHAANALPHLLTSHFKLDVLLRKWVDVSSKESFLDTLVTSFGILVLTALPDEGAGDVTGVMDLYRSLLKNKRIWAVLTLSRVCHVTWMRLRKRRVNADPRTEMHFYIMQLKPLLVSLRKREESSLLDKYVNKLLDKASEDTFRMAYATKEVIRDQCPEALVYKATRAVHGLMDYHALMDRENIVLTFQTFMWVLKNFVPASCDGDSDPDEAEVKGAHELCELAAPLLLAVLQALSTLLQAYRITWNEAYEGLCLLKLCHYLLANPHLPTKAVVLTLRMTRLTIAQCMPPSLVLLVDRIEGTALEAVGPLLVRKLHDPNWEVRDSSLEVLATISQLALDKYPAFQDLLVCLQVGPLAVSMLQGDAEGYVRATAMQAIGAMAPLDRLWTDCLAPQQVGRVVQNIIRTDTEGVVRGQAALLIASLLRHCRVPSDAYDELMQTMLRVTLDDLHWEVRVNALDFWAEVIDRELQEQGMVDGVFPPVTFSRETKKIVQLTEKEVQARLLRMLERLSRGGCLNAILAALQDDCDQEVVVKATKVVDRLLAVLRLYRVVPSDSAATSKKRKCSPDRKSSRSFTKDGNGSTALAGSVASDNVIEGIVNSTDLKLLAGVVITEDDGEQAPGKHAVLMVSPDAFLAYIQDLDLAQESNDTVDDLATLLDDVLCLSKDGGNEPDCY